MAEALVLVLVKTIQSEVLGEVLILEQRQEQLQQEEHQINKMETLMGVGVAVPQLVVAETLVETEELEELEP